MASSDQFVQLLVTLMSPDNALRNQAEAFYTNQLESNTWNTFQELVRVLSEHQVENVARSLAGVLLRRAVEKYAKSLDPAVFAQFKTSIMELWASETNPEVLNKYSHIMAQAAAVTPWPGSSFFPLVKVYFCFLN